MFIDAMLIVIAFLLVLILGLLLHLYFFPLPEIRRGIKELDNRAYLIQSALRKEESAGE